MILTRKGFQRARNRAVEDLRVGKVGLPPLPYALLTGAGVFHPLSLAFTNSLTSRPSAFLPARLAWAAFITFPISFIEVAPVSASAASIACSIASREAACGK